MRILGGLACALALAGCSTPGFSPADDAGVLDAPAPDAPLFACPAGFLGDPSLEPTLEIHVLRVDGNDVPLADKDDVPLIFPPQGGRVVFVGARATNLDGCGIQLTGAIRDESTRQVRVDARTVNLNPTGDGWGTTAAESADGGGGLSAALSSYSNVPLCPNQWASTDVFNHPFELTVTLKDRNKRTATKTIHVTPRCAEVENVDECLCICRLGYVLGQKCVTDAGSNG